MRSILLQLLIYRFVGKISFFSLRLQFSLIIKLDPVIFRKFWFLIYRLWKSWLLPEGPAKKASWRRVLRTMYGRTVVPKKVSGPRHQIHRSTWFLQKMNHHNVFQNVFKGFSLIIRFDPVIFRKFWFLVHRLWKSWFLPKGPAKKASWRRVLRTIIFHENKVELSLTWEKLLESPP